MSNKCRIIFIPLCHNHSRRHKLYLRRYFPILMIVSWVFNYWSKVKVTSQNPFFDTTPRMLIITDFTRVLLTLHSHMRLYRLGGEQRQTTTKYLFLFFLIFLAFDFNGLLQKYFCVR